AAGEHDVGLAVSKDFKGLADGLRASGARGHAVAGRSLAAEVGRQVPEDHVGPLLDFAEPIETVVGAGGPADGVQPASGLVPPLQPAGGEVVEVEAALAGAKVRAEAAPLQVITAAQPALFPRLGSGAEREASVEPDRLVDRAAE